MMQVSHCVTDCFNSLPIDELGNCCKERLMGVPDKYEAQQGGFHVSETKPCKWPLVSTITQENKLWELNIILL